MSERVAGVEDHFVLVRDSSGGIVVGSSGVGVGGSGDTSGDGSGGGVISTPILITITGVVAALVRKEPTIQSFHNNSIIDIFIPSFLTIISRFIFRILLSTTFYGSFHQTWSGFFAVCR